MSLADILRWLFRRPSQPAPLPSPDYRARFDAVYAANRGTVDALTRAPSGSYELAYVHFALGLIADKTGDPAYTAESLRLYEAEWANRSRWTKGHRQNELHFALGAARLARRHRPEYLPMVASLVSRADLAAAIKEARTSPNVCGSQAVMIASIALDLGMNGAEEFFAAFRHRIEPFRDGSLLWDRERSMPWTETSQPGQDTSHAWRHICAFRTAYEHGLPGYSSAEMRGFARLLGYVIWNQDSARPSFANYIDGGDGPFNGHPPGTFGNVLGGWPWLAQFDPQAKRAMQALHDARRAGRMPSQWNDQPLADLVTAAALL